METSESFKKAIFASLVATTGSGVLVTFVPASLKLGSHLLKLVAPLLVFKANHL